MLFLASKMNANMSFVCFFNRFPKYFYFLNVLIENKKLMLFQVNSQPSNRFIVYAKYDLSKNRNVRIEPDVEIDSRAQIAYFLYGNKVKTC